MKLGEVAEQTRCDTSQSPGACPESVLRKRAHAQFRPSNSPFYAYRWTTSIKRGKACVF